MPLKTKLLSQLTNEERDACTQYYADATMLHACTQGWSDDFSDSPKMLDMRQRAAELTTRLESAISKFELTEDGIVYSGHGRGFSTVGSLRGNPKRFVGLNYCYPGFISTSFDRGTAESYLRTRAKSVGTPTLLELRLKRGAHALYMDVATGLIAAEYLLGPRLTFNVINAEFTTIDHVDGEVLYLVLESLDKPVLAETFDGPR